LILFLEGRPVDVDVEDRGRLCLVAARGRVRRDDRVTFQSRSGRAVGAAMDSGSPGDRDIRALHGCRSPP
jgi:hypothetical protein